MYDVIIIGAGIGGLSAGLHLIDKGHKTLILEAEPTPGGLCTSFERRGFTFDTCIHWLMGCTEGGMVRRPLEKFGLLDEVRLKYLEPFATIRTPDAEVTIGSDLSEFERFLCRLSPRDERALVRFFTQARSLPPMIVPSPEDRRKHPLRSLGILFSYWPVIRLAFQYGRHDLETFLNRFQEKERIRPYLGVFGDDCSALISFYLFSWVHRRDLYAPAISSLDFARAFESKFRQMGGEIKYRTRASKVMVKDGKAAGVQLQNGEEIPARAVVSNADGYQTLFLLLGDDFVPPALAHIYRSAPLFGSMLLVSLGVGVPLTEKDAPARMTMEYPAPAPFSTRLADLERAPFTYKVESLYNPAAAPPGKGVLLAEAVADYEEWHRLRLDPVRYQQAKHRAQEIAVRRAENAFPQIRGKVEFVDVATPVTFERYTSNRDGSIQGWKPSPQMMRRMYLPWKPTALPNFFMVGQWVAVGGGIPPSIMGGEKVAGLVQKVLK
ncbi:MAG: NAD(P)/FAD-dependent oxidoreductase [Chloroflexi bacterium]|nr:NAD(P)/FAD-dependent oxidoreductase [Chloroflexota bacterium]